MTLLVQPPPTVDVQATRVLRVERTLDQLVVLGRNALLRQAYLEAVRRSIQTAPLVVTVGPVALYASRVYCAWTGESTTPVSPGLLAAAISVAVVSWTAFELLQTRRQFARTRAEALACFDAKLVPPDQLRTADEFLRNEMELAADLAGAMKREAILAAFPAAKASLAQTPHLPPLRRKPFHPARLLGLLLCALLSAWLLNGGATPQSGLQKGRTPWTGKPDKSTPNVDSWADRTSAPSAESDKKSEPAPGPVPERRSNGTPTTERRMSANEGDAATDKATPAKVAEEGTTLQGSSAAGESAEPSASPKREQSRPRTESPLSARQEGALAEESQRSTEPGADQGSASAVNPKPQRDTPPQTQAPESLPSPGGSDSEREKDTDETESSGNATLPMRNEQVRDVDRNLGVGTPAEPPPDARPNGRSGAGEVKKSRGVPTTVLGIPIPDRVPGTPGEGLTKTTVEAAPPQPTLAPALSAQKWQGRISASDRKAKRPKATWQQQLLQRYFPKSTPKQDNQALEP